MEEEASPIMLDKACWQPVAVIPLPEAGVLKWLWRWLRRSAR